MIRKEILLCALAASQLLVAANCEAQTFGIELHNTVMPASGGMAGASIARPQDPISAINANPATLSQFHGTNFTFGAAVIDADFRLTQTAPFPAIGPPIVSPFSAESNFPTGLAANLGITQELCVKGRPVTMGLGLITSSGGGVDFAGVPESNATASSLVILTGIAGLGVDLTDRLSAGASFHYSAALNDPLFVGISNNVVDFAPRGSFGLTYDVGRATTLAAYYQTKQNFTFEDNIVLNLGGGTFGGPLDVQKDRPRNVGLGIANESLMGGKLLIAVDVLWKNWNDADTFRDLYDDQWVVQVGTQYDAGRAKLRMGYAWAENPLQEIPPIKIGPITPPGLNAAIQYAQAQVALINQHRFTIGAGVEDVLQDVDLDLHGGWMFDDSETIGATTVDVGSWWIGFGLTWHFCGTKSFACCR